MGTILFLFLLLGVFNLSSFSKFHHYTVKPRFSAFCGFIKMECTYSLQQDLPDCQCKIKYKKFFNTKNHMSCLWDILIGECAIKRFHCMSPTTNCILDFLKVSSINSSSIHALNPMKMIHSLCSSYHCLTSYYQTPFDLRQK